MNDELFKATRTKNNIKNHLFDIGDYPLCRDEAELILRLLEVYVKCLEDEEHAKTTV